MWKDQEDRKLKLRRLEKRMKKTEDAFEDRSEKEYEQKDINLQIEMVENQNEWRRRIHMDDH